MNILMVTNTFTPHVSGVARSVEAFTAEFRRLGHRVLVIAPEFDGAPADERDVIRMPALQHFNGSDFSVRLPVPAFITPVLEEFQPDIVHSHHPFLLGGTALRIAASWNIPLVFTHHTMYEQYTHYVPGDSPALQRFVVQLATGYANLCDQVVAPSESVAAVLRERGVESPTAVIPTGVDAERFAHGDGAGFRRAHGIPLDAFVVGHLGRLAEEKNLGFLAEAVVRFLRKDRRTHFLLAGSGPDAEKIRDFFGRSKLSHRLHAVGVLKGQDVVDAYQAMDVFAFASQSETQGMVLTEAMAAGVPVVAVDASGVREVAADGRNGRLLPSQHLGSFVAALRWIHRLPPEKRADLRRGALETAQQFSMPRTAERTLDVYRALIGQEVASKQADDSLWDAALRRWEAEWELWSNRARAAATAIHDEVHPSRVPILRHLIAGWRRFRRAISRREWTVRLLRLPRSRGTATEPGLVLLQIDGLSRTQLERALHRRRMPFLRRLLAREGYQLHTLYSGLPSTTAAVQAELFYGAKTGVAAFAFQDHRTGELVKMIDPDAAARIQQELATNGRGLLEGGSSYSNIYSGGAAETHFCPATLGWGNLLENAGLLRSVVVFLWNAMSLVRTAFLLVVEFFLAIVDCIRGLFAGHDLWRELKFVPNRVAVSVLLREFITIGAEVDATRGLPIIHVNFLGYDEQAHRRGPGSMFAHWSLKGIDRAVQRICEAAHASRHRDYQVWIYSDHGQERTRQYPKLSGKSVQEAVEEICDGLPPNRGQSGRSLSNGESQRSAWLGGRRFQRLLRRLGLEEASDQPMKRQAGSPPSGSTDERRVGFQPARQELEHGDSHGQAESLPYRARSDDRTLEPVVADTGPLGHIYFSRTMLPEEREQIARRLAAEARVPLIFARDEDSGPEAVWVWTAQSRLHLPEDAEKVFGPDHPFLDDVARDLASLCRHPDAGGLVICGWSASESPMSLIYENGGHAGPGPEETGAFALVPADAPLPQTSKDYLRPVHVREAALAVLGRKVSGTLRVPSAATGAPSARTGAPVASVDASSATAGAAAAEAGVTSPVQTGRNRDAADGTRSAPATSADTRSAAAVLDSPRTARRTVRIMTYNVHSCLGLDGKLSPARIARVIAQADPDIVALQELDVGRARSGSIDQVHEIARILEMDFHFHPALEVKEERYGDAVLSRFPMRLVHAGPLPTLRSLPGLEPRGAIWTSITVDGGELQLLNTHLGLSRRERLKQINALLGPEWLSHPNCGDAVVVCGDFNARPASQEYRRLAAHLQDAQLDLDGYRPRHTWFSRFPVTRIDHVFVGKRIVVEQAEVPRHRLACVASDHLPLIVDVKIV